MQILTSGSFFFLLKNNSIACQSHEVTYYEARAKFFGSFKRLSKGRLKIQIIF